MVSIFVHADCLLFWFVMAESLFILPWLQITKIHRRKYLCLRRIKRSMSHVELTVVSSCSWRYSRHLKLALAQSEILYNHLWWFMIAIHTAFHLSRKKARMRPKPLHSRSLWPYQTGYKEEVPVSRRLWRPWLWNKYVPKFMIWATAGHVNCKMVKKHNMWSSSSRQP